MSRMWRDCTSDRRLHKEIIIMHKMKYVFLCPMKRQPLYAPPYAPPREGAQTRSHISRLQDLTGPGLLPGVLGGLLTSRRGKTQSTWRVKLGSFSSWASEVHLSHWISSAILLLSGVTSTGPPAELYNWLHSDSLKQFCIVRGCCHITIDSFI